MKPEKHNPMPSDDAGERRRSFAGAKFDLLDCLSQDPRLTHLEFRVAFRLIQHANGETGAMFPAQQTIAEQIGIQARAVRNAIAGLKNKGWLLSRRGGYNRPNFYAFDDRHANAILDRAASMADARREDRAARKLGTRRQKYAGQLSVTGKIMPVPTGISVPIRTGMELPPNTLRGTPEEEHLNQELGFGEEEHKGGSRDAA